MKNKILRQIKIVKQCLINVVFAHIKKINLLFIIFTLPLLSQNCYAEIITVASGADIKGTIIMFSDNIVELQGDKLYAIELDDIKDARIDDGVKGKAALKQQSKIDKLDLVIDKEKYLRKDFRKIIKKYFLAHEFNKIEMLAENIRKNKIRYPSGTWKIADIYIGLKDDIDNRDVSGFKSRLELINTWLKEKPSSLTARIALMAVDRSLAWAYRGSGYSNTVTSKARLKFREKLKEIIDIGEPLRLAHKKDPMLYVYLISAYNAYGKSKKSIVELAVESESIVPDFSLAYTFAINALLPKWGGSTKLVIAFLNIIVKNNHSPDLYYRLVKSAKDYIRDKEYGYFGFNWLALQRSFNAYQKQNKTLDKDLYLMAKFAALHGDRKAAKKYFSLTSGQWNHFAKSVWGEKVILNKFKDWSNEKVSLTYQKVLNLIASNVNMDKLPDILKIYITTGGDIDRGDIFNNTFLHYAVLRNDIKLTKFLIESGSNPNIFNVYGKTPLHIAADHNFYKLINPLLKSGADISAGTKKWKNTAMHLSARKGYDKVLRRLLNSDAEYINAVNLAGSTPLHLAALGGYQSTAAILLNFKQIDLNAQTNNGNTTLHYAVSRGHIDIVSMLVDAGADLNIKNALNHTALSLAKEKKFQIISRYLQEHHAADSSNVLSVKDLDKADKLLNEAAKYSNSTDYKKAIALYEEAIKYNTSFSLAYYSLALVQYQFANNAELADKYITKAILLDPAYAENYYIAGRINYVLNRPEKYTPYFQKYVELAPDTYNTRDLKKNYANLLVNSKNSKKPHNKIKQKLVLTNGVYYSIILILLVFIVLLLKKRGKSQNHIQS